jgi:RimJ/RimL family protein N-acetyltransferase
MLGGYFTNNTGYPITGPFTAMGFLDRDKILGQAIFNDYTGANMEIHLYAPKCFTKPVISSVYKYVFNFMKCVRLTAKPSTRNEKLYQLLERLGFEYEFTQKDYYKDNDGAILDALVYKLTRNNVPDWVKL